VSLKRGAKVFKRSNPALPVSLPGLIEALVGFCIGSPQERRFLFAVVSSVIYTSPSLCSAFYGALENVV